MTEIYVLAWKEGDDDREGETYEFFLSPQSLRTRIVDLCTTAEDMDARIPATLFKWVGNNPLRFNCGELGFRMYKSWAS